MNKISISLIGPSLAQMMPQQRAAAGVDLVFSTFLAIMLGVALVVVILFVWQHKDRVRRQKREDADHHMQREAFLKREEVQRRDIEQNISLGNESLRKMRLEIELMELQKRRLLGGPPPIVGPDADDESVPPTPTHEDLNRLMAQKMERELKLLDVQVELARRDQAMRSDQLDYHDTMMEKAKLEIESLKLHIKEQRKRLDEGFGG